MKNTDVIYKKENLQTDVQILALWKTLSAREKKTVLNKLKKKVRHKRGER
ncbi:MAG: hypothetical protein IKV53_07405 [Clostridia bacterium]|nr:hypothetical protein [Clostridia bacterium]